MNILRSIDSIFTRFGIKCSDGGSNPGSAAPRTENGEHAADLINDQPLVSAKYFHSRPSNAGNGYAAANSGGTNHASTNQRLIEGVRSDASSLHQENLAQPIPVHLVTTSASGLDREISSAAAEFQIPRIAREGAVPESAIRDLARNAYERDLGLLGEPRVNVLELNLVLALDELAGKHS
jgi:K+-transporting ATPase ATPase C chain